MVNFLFRHHINVPVKLELQRPPPAHPGHTQGIPRALDCVSFPGRGEFERCLGRVGNLKRIFFLVLA